MFSTFWGFLCPFSLGTSLRLSGRLTPSYDFSTSSDSLATVPQTVLISEIPNLHPTTRSGLQISSQGGNPTFHTVGQHSRPGCSLMVFRRGKCSLLPSLFSFFLPPLLNLFLSHLPTSGISIASHADDLTIISRHGNQPGPVLPSSWLTKTEGCFSLQVFPHTLWIQGASLFLLPRPCQSVYQDPWCDNDRGMTFAYHTAEVNARGKSRQSVMRALSSTTSGHNKEQQTALYNQLDYPWPVGSN